MDTIDSLRKISPDRFPERRTANDTLPVSIEECRALMLEAARFNPDELGEATRKGFDKLIDLLEAKTTKFASHDGIITDSREVSDNNAQRKAAEAIIQIGFDVYPGSKDKDIPVDHTTIIDLSSWVPKKEKE